MKDKRRRVHVLDHNIVCVGMVGVNGWWGDVDVY
jgi:hypothetical protein